MQPASEMNVEAPPVSNLEQQTRNKIWLVSDSDQQNRNQILVVAGLVTAASYQAAMSPPDALKDGDIVSLVIFYCACTLAWSFSATLILSISYYLPCRREIYGAFAAMGFSFAYAVIVQTENATAFILFVVCSATPWLIRVGLSLCKCT